jgi:uncharacterized membrane protein
MRFYVLIWSNPQVTGCVLRLYSDDTNLKDAIKNYAKAVKENPGASISLVSTLIAIHWDSTTG